MCGIFGYIGYDIDIEVLRDDFNKMKGRGPDYSELKKIVFKNGKCIIFGFHRLSINDLSEAGNQPMILDQSTLVCNGEIFNHKNIEEDHEFNYKSNSDCESILHLYNKTSIMETVNTLDAEFAFLLYDNKKDILYAARDPFGVRPLFIGYDNKDNTYFSSEIKGISNLCVKINRFRPGCVWESSSKSYSRYYLYYYIDKFSIRESGDLDIILKNIRDKLTTAVHKRLMSDRPVGCLLSGGLDSSLISSIVSKQFKLQNKGELNTFSIGMKGSSDLYFANKVAEFIGSKHHHVELKKEDFLNAIEEVIYNIESYDTTTVRASVGNYLVGKYIKENTDITVVYNGDGSDEQSGYLYLKNAPNPREFSRECAYLLENIHMFDCLRSDRSISSKWSLESRTPFLDKDFVEYYMNIDTELKMYNGNKIEKELLRKAFNDGTYLPDEVLWRNKEAFSDGCSSSDDSWYKIIQNHIDTIITDEEFESEKIKYTHNQPELKESLYYRQIFDKYYPGHYNVIDNFWLPKWCGDQKDPSARELSMYKENVDMEDCYKEEAFCNIS